ncbi:MAG: metallophosphoesterase [Spirochaetota bacterium]
MNDKSYTYIPHRGRTIIIGDLHGCHDEFMRLLDAVSFADDDICILAGDFVNRGPDSASCADFLRKTPNCYSVVGNHEKKLQLVINGDEKPAWSQEHTLSQLDDRGRTLMLETIASLPAVIETPLVTVTHAMLDPSRTTDMQDPVVTTAYGIDDYPDSLDDEGVPAWYRRWRERFGSKPVCMGHKVYKRVELVAGSLYALDTGAVRGGQLTALVLPERRIVQIQASADHHEESYRTVIRQERR